MSELWERPFFNPNISLIYSIINKFWCVIWIIVLLEQPTVSKFQQSICWVEVKVKNLQIALPKFYFMQCNNTIVFGAQPCLLVSILSILVAKNVFPVGSDTGVAEFPVYTWVFFHTKAKWWHLTSLAEYSGLNLWSWNLKLLQNISPT